MNTKARLILMFTLVLLMGGALWGMLAQAAPWHGPLAQGGAPAVVSYQGEVRVSDSPYTGAGYFKFAVVDAAGNTTYWSNDGSSSGGSEPTAAVTRTVSEGLFSVLLGDTTLGGMTQALTADVFDQPDRYLRVWFSTNNITFEQLAPDTHIAAVPYALQAQEALNADTVDGLHAGELGAHYKNVVIVAKSGGNYTSVQVAIDSIGDASADNPYLVWVAPGVYSETVTMKPYVHLQGAGQEATIITSTAGSGSGTWPPQATLQLSGNASLRDLTVGNSGLDYSNVALLATENTSGTLVADVTARTQVGGEYRYAIVLNGSGTYVTLQQVTALAENGGTHNIGLLNEGSATAMLYGGSFTGRWGETTYGVYNADGSTTLEAEGVTVVGEKGTDINYGLYNDNGAAAVLRGSAFTGRGGEYAYGLSNADGSTTLEAESVTALAEGGSSGNQGLVNYDGATAILRDGSFTARGGTDAWGIFLLTGTLEAHNVTALGENGSDLNSGLFNLNNSTAVLYGGSYTGRGGAQTRGVEVQLHSTVTAYGISALAENGSGTVGNYALGCYDQSTTTVHGGVFVARGGMNNYALANELTATVAAENVTALAEYGSDSNYGLWNANNATLVLQGASLTGRGGTDAYGVGNQGGGTTLVAGSVTAVGEDGSNLNYGLYNSTTADVTLLDSSFTGSGGGGARGIYVNGSTLEAANVTALAGNATNSNYGLDNHYGAVTTLNGGYFGGRGGQGAIGIVNYGTLTEARDITALGETGISHNYGLYSNSSGATANVTQAVLEGATYSVLRSNGTVTVSNSRLAGNVVSGTVTCVLVTRGTTISTDGSTCP